jgi:hypothetical protein
MARLATTPKAYPGTALEPLGAKAPRRARRLIPSHRERMKSRERALEPQCRTSPSHRDRQTPRAMAQVGVVEVSVEPTTSLRAGMGALGAVAPKPSGHEIPRHPGRKGSGAVARRAVEPGLYATAGPGVLGALALRKLAAASQAPWNGS